MVKRHTARQELGFTLIEMLVVVTIIGILAGMAMVMVKNYQRRAAENVLKMDLTQMRKAIDDFYADKQRYPGSLNELVEEGYMRRIPEDPVTKSAETWVEVPAEPDPTSSFDSFSTDLDAAAGPGVVDVKSGAEGATLDNVPYEDL